MTDETLPPVGPVQKWFEAIWAQREDALYPEFFGPLEGGMYPLRGEMFSRYGKANVDPRFLTHGVLVSPPNPGRPTWLYVTSGMSNPWGATPETAKPEEYSGLGFELVMETPAEDGRAAWAVSVLHWLMVVQLLVATGDAQGELIAFDDRVPVGGAIDGKGSGLNTVLVCRPEPPCRYPERFALASGQVDLMLCVGLAQREREFAAAQGSDGLLKLLRHRGAFPVTDPGRASVV
jgi:hypothetical protein